MNFVYGHGFIKMQGHIFDVKSIYNKLVNCGKGLIKIVCK